MNLFFRYFSSFRRYFSFFNRIWPYIKAGGPILFLIIFIAVHVIVWWFGPNWVFGDERPFASITARLMFSVGFTVLCFLLLSLFQRKEINEYKKQKQADERLKTDPLVRYIERQDYELDHLMMNLKASLNTRNYLYRLPWYFVLGMEESGKTSFINRSGQDFFISSTMRSGNLRSENPYSYEWWISNEAVIIDPNGKLLTQVGEHSKESIKGDGDDVKQIEQQNAQLKRRLWLSFLDWVERTRNLRPLNGVIFTVDIAYLATADIADRRAYANLFRARLREMMEILATRLPVYVVLTKLDLLNGFSGFFKHYTKAQREEVLGFTFTLDSISESDAWIKEFDQEYGSFVRRINDLIPKILMQTRDSEERKGIYSFSRQLAGVSDILSQFLKDVLLSDQFNTSPIVRGVYLTSVYQQGVPADVFLNAISKRYRMINPVNRAQNNQNSTSFFSNNLFKDIILPEAGLATDNTRSQKNKQRNLATATILGGLGALLSVGLFHHFYNRNSERVDEVKQQVELYNRVNISAETTDPTGKTFVQPLNLIREATLKFGHFRDRSKYFADTGLYLGHKVGPEVEQTYIDLLAYRFMPSLLAGVAKLLDEAPQNSDEQLELLRVFKMLIDRKARQDSVVIDYFTKYWQQTFEGNRDLQEKLMSHLEYALKYTDLVGWRGQRVMQAEKVLLPYDDLLLRAQQDLSQMPTDQRVYRSFKRYGLITLGMPLDLRTVVGASFDTIFNVDLADSEKIKIPSLFTKIGLDRYFVGRSDTISDISLIDNWVIGKRDNLNYSPQDKIELNNKLRDFYIADYINTWRAGLEALDINEFKDIPHGVLILSDITGSNVPFRRLLNSIRENTRLIGSVPDDPKAREEFMKSLSYVVGEKIANNFAAINRLILESEAQPAFWDEVTVAINNLKTYLQTIESSPNPGKTALETAKSRLKLTDADPIYVMKRIADKLPQPFDRMMTRLADETWRVILREAIKELDRRWKTEVYEEFNLSFAPKYPFNPRSQTDVSLAEFERFFGPEGVINRFYNEELKIFLDETIAQASGKQKYSAIVRAEVIEQVERARMIREAFFNQKGNLNVEFVIEPIALGPQMRRSVLNIEGQYVEFAHAAKIPANLLWPNTIGERREATIVKLTLVPTKQNQLHKYLTFEGPWALFRLLDRAQVYGLDSQTMDLAFILDDIPMRYRLTSRNSINPFTTPLLRTFTLPSSLY